ncbi:MAG: hypothetical protein IJA61_03125 [Clostridia bacterium]|nr:hypothetical protein [Clostridia bacterium]
MKNDKRVEYLNSTEIMLLPQTKREKYLKDLTSLRRQMRSLIGYQDSPYSIKGGLKQTISSVVSHYGMEDSVNVAYSKIMESFVGAQIYKEEVKGIYDRKFEYDHASKEDKKKMKKVYSPIDYMDLKTMYHFYKFRQKIIELDQQRIQETGKRTVSQAGFDQLLADARKACFAERGVKNLFFSEYDINFKSSPIASFSPINALQSKQENAPLIEDLELSLTAQEDLKHLPVEHFIKADVLRYMLSYVDKTKSLTAIEKLELRGLYTEKAVSKIKSMKVCKPAKEVLADRYNFSGQVFTFEEDQNKELSLTGEDFKELRQNGLSVYRANGRTEEKTDKDMVDGQISWNL